MAAPQPDERFVAPASTVPFAPAEKSPPATVLAAACRVTIYGATALGGDMLRVRAVIEVRPDAPFTRRQSRAEPGRTTLAIALEDARCTLTNDAATLGAAEAVLRLHMQADAVGTTVILDTPEAARTRLTVLRAPLRFVFDAERERAGAGLGRSARLVVLDPGHGGRDRGSPGLFGLWEADVALDVVRRTARWLRHAAPDLRVRMTRERDEYVTLEERAAMANALDADLFVSFHLNAAEEEVERGGVATFVLDATSEGSVRSLAARENGTALSEISPLQMLVGGLLRTEQQTASLALAHHVQRALMVMGRRVLPRLPNRGVKRSMFYVLVGAAMPAILVEGSFLTQPDEAHALTTEQYRDSLAEGLGRGILRSLGEL